MPTGIKPTEQFQSEERRELPPQETLLAGTRAITRGCIEWQSYKGGYLVRYKNLKGYVIQRRFKDADSSGDLFIRCIGKLREDLFAIRTGYWEGLDESRTIR